jgi:hypothetical protein
MDFGFRFFRPDRLLDQADIFQVIEDAPVTGGRPGQRLE